jgi:hypothetical protein
LLQRLAGGEALRVHVGIDDETAHFHSGSEYSDYAECAAG